MNKISARGIQLFVGGALAMDGFDSTYSLFYHLIYVRSFFNLIDLIIAGLLLLLGIGILKDYARAIQLTVIYLWIMVILLFTAVPLYCYLNPAKTILVIWRNANPLLVSVTLLALIHWSRSPRFRDKSDGGISN